MHSIGGSAKAPITTLFVFLRGDHDHLESRTEPRSDRYMGVNMLESQLETLEEPIDAGAVG